MLSRKLNRWDFRKLDFADLQFPTKQFLCEDSQGRKLSRWLPYGMPHFSRIIEQVVIYLFGRSPKTGDWELGGSGFLFGYPSDRDGANHIYAVTNWHVAIDGGFSSIRLHSRAGLDFIEPDDREWIFLPGKDDLAIADITDYVDPERDSIVVIDAEMAATSEYAEKADIGFGDDVFMIGLFANSPGADRNVPVARFGNIARRPTQDALIEQDTGARLPCYLVDMRSRTGFSGSPVFVFRTATSDLRPLTDGGAFTISGLNSMLNLLGVHCAQYPESFDARLSEAIGDPILEGDKLKGPSAMNVVIPAWRIFDALEHPDLRRRRMDRDKRRSKEANERPVPESKSAPPTKEDNPSHEADFNRLRDAAALTPKSDGRT